MVCSSLLRAVGACGVTGSGGTGSAGGVGALTGDGGRGGDAVVEDRRLEVAQGRTGVDPQFAGQIMTYPPQGVERVRLSALLVVGQGQ